MGKTAKQIAKVIRKELIFHARTFPTDQKTAIALSGGVDSCSVLAAMLEAGHRPLVISYTPDTHESTDFKMARQTADNLGLKFKPAIVSMDADDLENGVRTLVQQGFKTKLEAESLSPMLTILKIAKASKAKVMFTGDQSDGFFINNNWMARNYDRSQGIPGYLRHHVKLDKDATRIDILRDIYWNEDRSCSNAIRFLGDLAKVKVAVPYRSELIRDTFRGTHWTEINEPRLKEPIKLAFEDWFTDDKILTRPMPVNLHRGDSNFASSLGTTLMSQPHLAGPWRTPTGLYAAMARGDI